MRARRPPFTDRRGRRTGSRPARRRQERFRGRLRQTEHGGRCRDDSERRSRRAPPRGSAPLFWLIAVPTATPGRPAPRTPRWRSALAALRRYDVTAQAPHLASTEGASFIPARPFLQSPLGGPLPAAGASRTSRTARLPARANTKERRAGTAIVAFERRLREGSRQVRIQRRPCRSHQGRCTHERPSDAAARQRHRSNRRRPNRPHRTVRDRFGVFAGSDASDEPSIFTAVEEQLGLKLESTGAPVHVLGVDSVERPSPD